LFQVKASIFSVINGNQSKNEKKNGIQYQMMEATR